MGEEYLKKAFKRISPGRVKRYGKVAHPSQQKMEEKAILKNIGKNYIYVFEVEGLKGRVGNTEVTFKSWGRVKYPVGYKKHNNVGVKGQDIALPFSPALGLHSAY